MKNELTKTENKQIALMDRQELSDIIRPLSEEIRLFDTYVSGVLNNPDQAIYKSLQEGQKLQLQRKETVFDSNSIAVYTEDKIQIGYIPEKDNVIFARLMDAGKLLTGKVNNVQFKESMPLILIGIYMVDY